MFKALRSLAEDVPQPHRRQLEEFLDRQEINSPEFIDLLKRLRLYFDGKCIMNVELLDSIISGRDWYVEMDFATYICKPTNLVCPKCNTFQLYQSKEAKIGKTFYLVYTCKCGVETTIKCETISKIVPD